jgi:Leucine-rich repeat (LRR) protein
MLLTRFACPHCDTLLKSAAGVQTGKAMVCPKCRERFVIAVADVEVVDERGDTEERPARRKRKKGKKSTNAISPIRILVLTGIVLLGVGGGIGLYVLLTEPGLFRRQPPENPLPTNQVRVDREEPKPDKPPKDGGGANIQPNENVLTAEAAARRLRGQWRGVMTGNGEWARSFIFLTYRSDGTFIVSVRNGQKSLMGSGTWKVENIQKTLCKIQRSGATDATPFFSPGDAPLVNLYQEDHITHEVGGLTLSFDRVTFGKKRPPELVDAEEKAVEVIKRVGGTFTRYANAEDGAITSIQFSWRGKSPTDSDLAAFANLTELTTLEIPDSPITDAGMAHLAGLKKLEGLILARTRISNAGLAHLEGLTELRSLDLGGTLITSAGVVHLKSLTKLESLSLYKIPWITDEALAHLQGMTNLSHLSLQGCQITDAGAAQLKAFTKLRELSCGNRTFRGDGLVQLMALPKLTQLMLDDSPITDKALAHLKDGTGLHSLSLNRTLVTDAGLEQLEGLTGLHHLSLSATRITDKGLIHLGRMSNLGRVYLDQTLITNAGLKHLKGLTKMRDLVMGFTRVTEAGAAELRRALPNANININTGLSP